MSTRELVSEHQVDFVRYRKQAKTFSFLLTENGGIYDASLGTMEMIANSAEDGSGTEIFRLPASGDLPNGDIDFTPSANDLDQAPAVFYYWVRHTIAGERDFPVTGRLDIRPGPEP